LNLDLKLTEAQWAEELKRIREAGVFEEPDWLKISKADITKYLTYRRIGATFRLSRKDRYDLAGRVHERLHPIPPTYKPLTQADINKINFGDSGFDFEGAILTRQEAHYD